MTIDLTLSIFSAALAIIVTVMIGGFALVFVQFQRLETKFDVLSTKMDNEFRIQRQEVTALVTAIANSITAAKAA
jgi:hypothetical protein